ncbi:hypothetical protein ACO0RG_004505 [Hanseniaspora osmophila]
MSTKPTKGQPKAKQLKPLLHPLVLYNLISALMWGFHLWRTLTWGLEIGPSRFYDISKNPLTFIQCCAVIEIFNSLFGFVRSPLFTVVAQVSSRLLIVLGVFQYMPTAQGPRGFQYITLSVAWCIAEIVRYLYYFYNLVQNDPPVFLSILRYNLFWVLYPLGVGSELYIIYSSLDSAPSTGYKYFLIGSMLTYIPGFPILFTHMMKQRKKVMKQIFGASKAKTN